MTARALKTLNEKWFSKLKTRWIDIVGSFAGKELFLVDGYSLIRHILDDPLLRLAKDDSVDCQLLHAVFSAEAFLHELKRRGAVFQVAFFTSNQFSAIVPNLSAWSIASRTLASKVIEAHIQSLDIPVEYFDSPEDADWKEFVLFNKPLFILCDDGGGVDAANEGTAASLLLRRYFISRMIGDGLFVASLCDIDYRDSQAHTFLFDRTPYEITTNIRDGIAAALKLFASITEKAEESFEEEVEAADDDESWTADSAKAFLSTTNSADGSLRRAILWVFLAHGILLRSLPLELRSQAEASLPPALVSTLTKHILPDLLTAFGLCLPNELTTQPPIDGRIFGLLLAQLIKPNAVPLKVLGAETFKTTETLWSSVTSDAVDFSVLKTFSTSSTGVTKSPAPEFDDFPLYPFDNQVFNEAFESVAVTTRSSTSPDSIPPPLLEFGGTSIFTSSTRRRTEKAVPPKHLGGDDGKPKDRRAREKMLRNNQRFMRNLERQAKSLTGAKGAPLEQEVITTIGQGGTASGRNTRPNTRPGTPDSQAGSRSHSMHQQQLASPKGKKPKEPKLSSADKLRAQIAAQKATKAASESENWWAARLKDLSDIQEIPERVEMLELQLKSRRVAEDKSLAAQMWLFRIHLECWRWVEDVRRSEPEVHDRYVVRLVGIVKHFGGYSTGGHLTPSMVKASWTVLEALGFEDYLESMVPRPGKDVADKKFAYDFIKLFKKASKTAKPTDPPAFVYPWMRIQEDPVHWQLRIFGEHMERSFDSRPDDRVKFEPDAWQREVLDKLDRDESVLVVAPTSAGKTFISYYAMKQVLTSSDDAILVYVAPTKALVTQIAAEVYARYRKDLKGRSCWAVYTADQHINNPLTCQILVTVPEVLAYMLLTPSLARAWTPRIKRIILDEIHMLGSQKGGAWEHIMTLCTAPVIGLSATVGEAEVFNDWLKGVQESHGHRHSLIQHKHRYSHLRKFAYITDPDPDPVDGLPGHKPSNNIRFLHPISFLRPGITSIPDDLALEARDCATLYQAMAAEIGDQSLAALEPITFFENRRGKLLQQQDIIRYEAALKKKLSEWMKANDVHHPTGLVQRVVRRLSDPDVGSEEAEEPLQKHDLFYSNLLNFLADLNASGDLPALLFNFDRYTIEAMAKGLLERLQKDEIEWRRNSPEWNKKIKGWQAWEAGAKERDRAAQRAAAKTAKAEGDKMDRLQAKAAVDSSPYAIYASFDPDAPSEEFCFTSWSTRYSPSELEDDIKEIDKWTTTPKFLLECLKRGIAVHHSGLNKRYRALVESLFRIGFCKVVISTEDLALGVNMPAKASVFCGDSPALTALMYRQCAGRAGRRGFDLLGKVIFYGIPHERVRQVVLSKLPALRGNYPLTPTLSLRLANLLSESGFAPAAVDAVQALFRLNRLTVGSDVYREQTVHQLRFSMEYLIRTQLIDSQGNPLHPWYSLAAYLSNAEPANFALLALFRAGYIHTLCEDTLVEAKRRLMHLLAFLFNRDFLSKSVIADKDGFLTSNRSPSKILLPPMEETVYNVLREHNGEVLEIFTEFAITYSVQQSKILGVDSKLPLSQRDVNEYAALPTDSEFVTGLKSHRAPVRSRSAFVATSGHGDVYKDVNELVRTVRTGIDLNKQTLPFADVFAPGSEETRYINAYLYDFYNHGQDNPLVHANHIPRGEVWYRLQEFSLVLASVVSSLNELITRDRKDDDIASTGAETDHIGGAVTVPDDWAIEPPGVKDEPITGQTKGSSTLPFEKEKGDDVEAAAAVTSVRGEQTLVRPAHVSERDWRVFEIFHELQDDFNAKFTAMWA